jgi:hypothetical protein
MKYHPLVKLLRDEFVKTDKKVATYIMGLDRYDDIIKYKKEKGYLGEKADEIHKESSVSYNADETGTITFRYPSPHIILELNNTCTECGRELDV